jgi:hypothetical protein
MKRTIAPPWAIVRRSALNKAADTEEANDRTSLGDRSLTRQRPWTNVRPQPQPHRTRTLSRGRTIAQQCAIVRTRDTQLHVTYLGHGHHIPIIFTHLSHTPRTSYHAAHLRRSLNSPSTTTNHHKSPPNHPHHHHRPIPPYPATTFIVPRPIFHFSPLP